MSSFAGWIDLASRRVGGRTLLASDEFFAPKENLLKPGRGVFIEGRYTDRGKWMDGWETRRRRGPGHDWCIVRLGIPGVVRGVTVDTHHFKGNHPEACSLDACEVADDSDPEALAAGDAWVELLPRSELERDFENQFPIDAGRRFTHVRLNIYPDGGVARLRIHGEARPDWRRVDDGGAVDLAAIEHGGRVITCSDRFFSQPLNLIMPGRGVDMGDGWETRRRRGPGHDWVLLQLGRRGMIDRVVVDTRHFKGNYPESCSLEGVDAPGETDEQLIAGEMAWVELLPRVELGPHTEHTWDVEPLGPATHVRFNIHPDGGVSRIRLYGRLAEEV